MNSEFDSDDPRHHLILEDGKAKCPECNAWYPRGMEYGFLDHYDSHKNLV